MQLELNCYYYCPPRDTFTDVSSMVSEMDSLSKAKSEEKALDNYDDLDSFKMPDLNLDLGVSMGTEVFTGIGGYLDVVPGDISTVVVLFGSSVKLRAEQIVCHLKMRKEGVGGRIYSWGAGPSTSNTLNRMVFAMYKNRIMVFAL